MWHLQAGIGRVRDSCKRSPPIHVIALQHELPGAHALTHVLFVADAVRIVNFPVTIALSVRSSCCLRRADLFGYAAVTNQNRTRFIQIFTIIIMLTCSGGCLQALVPFALHRKMAEEGYQYTTVPYVSARMGHPV